MVSQEIGNGSKKSDRTGWLRNSYQTLCKGESISDDHLNYAKIIMTSPEEVIGTRKLAAQIVYRCEKKFIPSWLVLVAACETEPLEKSTEIILAYLATKQSLEIGNSDEEFCFLTTLIQRFTKRRDDYARYMGSEQFAYTREKILFIVIILNELRAEDVSHLIKAVVKLYNTKNDQLYLLDTCMQQLYRVQLKAPFLVVSILLSNDPCPEWINRTRCILGQLSSLAANQVQANSVAPLISVFIDKLADNESFQTDLIENLIHYKSSVRSNTIRCWLSRASASRSVSSLFTSILQQLLWKWDDIAETSPDDVWPPFAYETEEISCIDPAWNWEESEGVWWIRDRLVHSYLSLLKLYTQKFPHLPITGMGKSMIMHGLNWHLSEVRLLAFQMAVLNSIENDIIERFLLVNATSINCDLHSTVHKHAKSFAFSCAGELSWSSIQKDNEDSCDDCPVFVPDGLQDEFILPSVQNIPNVIDEKLNIICEGSSDGPSFPVMYARLDAAGYHLRLYTKHLIMLMDALVTMSTDIEIVGSTIWKIITRCRLKAVVDRGCTHMECLISMNSSWADNVFSLAMTELISTSSSVRTLGVSRVLWSSCVTKPAFFESVWIGIKPFLSVNAHPLILTRILKTVKLFVSKSECSLPAASLEELFWFCIDVQMTTDFLVRSSATILFGFIVKSFTCGHQLPLFHLLIMRRTMWDELCRRMSLLCSISAEGSALSVLYRSQRMLLLSFLKFYNFIDASFYSECSIRMLDELRSDLFKVLKCTPDIRERRFIVDTLVQMSSKEDISYMEKATEIPMNICVNFTADTQYMASLLGCNERNLETRGEPVYFHFSPFVQRVKDVLHTVEAWKSNGVVESELTEIIEKLSCERELELELPSQCAAYVCSQLANGIVHKRISQAAAHMYTKQCLLLSRHTIPRVRAIVSRVAVNLKISDCLLHKDQFEKVLVNWSNNFVTPELC